MPAQADMQSFHTSILIMGSIEMVHNNQYGAAAAAWLGELSMLLPGLTEEACNHLTLHLLIMMSIGMMHTIIGMRGNMVGGALHAAARAD